MKIDTRKINANKLAQPLALVVGHKASVRFAGKRGESPAANTMQLTGGVCRVGEAGKVPRRINVIMKAIVSLAPTREAARGR